MRYPKTAIVFEAFAPGNKYWCRTAEAIGFDSEYIHLWHDQGQHLAYWHTNEDEATRGSRLKPLTPAAREFLKAAKAGR